MSSPRPPAAGHGLLLLLPLALTLRLAAVALLFTPHAAPITYEHGAIAENLLAGKGFAVKFLGIEGPTSQQAPLYPLLLASLYRLFGTGSYAAIVALQLLQCAAGTAVVACAIWLARSLAPARAEIAWLAGFGSAVYPPHIYAVTHVQVAIWAALGLTLLLAVVASPRWRVPWLQPAAAGLIAGLLLLIDPIMAVALPVVAVWIWLRLPLEGRWRLGWRRTLTLTLSHGERGPEVFRRIAPAALMAAVTLLVIVPWLIRNYRVHGELVFIKSTFGYALWQGNNPASWGTDKVPKRSADLIRRQHNGLWHDQDRALWEARHETLYIDDVLLKPSGYAEFAGLSEPQRSRLLGARASEFIANNPLEYGRLCLQRLRYFLLFDETNPKAAHWLYRLSTAIWLGLALAGPWVLRRQWRAWWPLYAVFGAVMLFHVLTIVSARFRIPVEPLSFCWAAATAAAAIGWCQRAIVGMLHRAHISGVSTLRRVNTDLGSSQP